jgi:type IV/VI secretion system ImpK/VasF family protein
MSVSNDIETLCKPVFVLFCNYWQLNSTGNPPSMEVFRKQIEDALEDIRYAAASSTSLSRAYQRIELPLVFFIDYMVKEGSFPFKNEWRELARNYNELSGDEKFFNLLSEALDSPDAGNTLSVFYTMLGLGFDGIYANDTKSVERIMKQCMSRLKDEFDICQEPIVNIDTEKRLTLSKKRLQLPQIRPLRIALIASIAFVIIAFIINLLVFVDATSVFRKGLAEAVETAKQLEINLGGEK